MTRLLVFLLICFSNAGPVVTEPPLPQQPSAIDPNQILATAERFMKDDKYEEALDAAGSAVERWPEHPAAHVAMADALYRRGDFEEAERHYRRAVEIDPNSATAHFGVGRILRTLGRYGEAAESFHKAAALAPEVPKHLRVLANHLARREDSLVMLRRYLDRVKRDPASEPETTARNVEAWVALLEKMGDQPLSDFAKKEPCEVALSVTGGQAHVKLTVAGLKNQRFVFDTGATGMTISPRVAARAKLEPIRPFTISGTGARRFETGTLVVVPEISVGEGIVIRNVPATVRDPAGPEEGLIGPSIFHPFAITVDLKSRRLAFETPGSPRAGVGEAFRNVGGEILLTARVNGVPLNAMLDTGASSTIVGATTLRRAPGLEAMPGPWGHLVAGGDRPGGGIGVGGAMADPKVIIKGMISFAGRDYTAAGVRSGDLSGFSRSLESEIYLILGSDHLDDSPFTIDYREMKVTFSPAAKGGHRRTGQ